MKNSSNSHNTHSDRNIAKSNLYSAFRQELEKSIDEYRSEAAEGYAGRNLSKADYIDSVICHFLSDLFSRIKPIPKVLEIPEEEAYVSANDILNKLGPTGVTIGAAVFRLAHQLEIELPANGIERASNSVVAFKEDGAKAYETAVPIVMCYEEFFWQDMDAVMKHIFYMKDKVVEKFGQESKEARIGLELMELPLMSQRLVVVAMQYLMEVLIGASIVESILEEYRRARSLQKNLSDGITKLPNEIYLDVHLILLHLGRILEILGVDAPDGK
ncbi:hypothetical protein STSP2_01396 [Anaerohalosphaera lusitana]|uniref:Uncharacterized protein n=1 Tax=Anaerohalosphaera lusitana TaxID=1936003 RepID=A0A1U9NKX6_9BACT|nr:hypothetical protein [Anaerohalosphaera lusitana]AQT68240.1 hypothetical protein STSP2_01396 [Anaerohalosphaera lusitana]